MNKRSLLFIVAASLSLFGINQFFDWQNAHRREELVASIQAKDPSPVVSATKISSPLAKNEPLKTSSEQFFVLENTYLQLVFSTIGGAVSEINLPFNSPSHVNSLVLPIAFDRTIEQESPENALFPLYPFYAPGKSSLLQPTKGGYYPLLRRSIRDPKQPAALAPKYYALTLLSQDSSSNNPTVYRVKRFEKNLIEFEGNEGGVILTKTYSLPQNEALVPYCFDLTIRQNGAVKPLALTSGIPEVELISDSFSPLVKYFSTAKNRGKVTQISLPKESSSFSDPKPTWVSNSNGFFGLIINPVFNRIQEFDVEKIPGEKAPSRLTTIDSAYDLYPAAKYPGYQASLRMDPTKEVETFRVFAGPYVKELFEKIDAAYYDPSTKSSPEFESAMSFHGWFAFISEPFAKFLLFLMKLFYFVTHSWGISIILLTIALRVMLYPLNTWSIRSTMKMQEIAPQVQALQARYKKDPKRAQIEIMHLYKDKGVNPLSGCLPLLIQLPFLIGMFDLLKSTFELRGVNFIPGWITNLTAPDVVFSWSYPIYFIGNEFHLLPILLGAVMYVQQRFSSSASQNSAMPMTDQQRQQKFMGNIMTVVFTFMFYNFPSGLNIYWLSSMLLGILQQWFMVRKKRRHPKIEVLK